MEKLKDNVYIINVKEEDIPQIKKKIVLKKHSFKGGFSLDDLVLVRAVNQKYIPRNMEYYSMDQRNSCRFIANPFCYAIGYGIEENPSYENIHFGKNLASHEFRGNKIVCSLHRDTKHFTINGLVSNVANFLFASCNFDTDFIIIEPLKNKILDKRMMILNPIDTFFDLSYSSMKIDPEAVFLIKRSVYENLDEETLKNIGTRRIYLYTNYPEASLDIVLLTLGILPMHSKNQTTLISEGCQFNNEYYYDELYLQQFQLYIDKLNREYMNMSYLELPKKIINNRKNYNKKLVDVPGIFHAETEFFKNESKQNLRAELEAYREYLYGLSLINDGVSSQVTNKIYQSLRRDAEVDDWQFIVKGFKITYEECEGDMIKILETLTYPVFKQYTQNYNAHKLKKIDKTRIG